MIILAYLSGFYKGGSAWPTINFGSSCSGHNSYQQTVAPGLLNCTSLASQIVECQRIGKKVLLSIGGFAAGGNVSIPNDQTAISLATSFWGLFGPVNLTLAPWLLRPFGNVTLDGFEIASTSGGSSIESYNAFAQTLKDLFATDPSKRYYLSAAPQCPIPERSIPLGLMRGVDFVWPQYYKNPECDLSNTSAFADNYRRWAQILGWPTNGAANNKAPMLLVGATGNAHDGQSGYVPTSNLTAAIDNVRNMSCFGGMSLWDGGTALHNTNPGPVAANGTYLNYLQVARIAIDPPHEAAIISQAQAGPPPTIFTGEAEGTGAAGIRSFEQQNALGGAAATMGVAVS